MEKPSHVPRSDWIRGHYHCRKCGGELECWWAFSYHRSNPDNYGVSRIGGCQSCGQIMVEYENKPPVWVEAVL